MKFAEALPALTVTRKSFDGLSPVERRTLLGWIDAARSGGIETAEDLGLRLWPNHGGESVIGVFKSGHLLASWLVVGRDGSWAVASCGDGAVSPRVASLADALRLVYPQQKLPVVPRLASPRLAGPRLASPRLRRAGKAAVRPDRFA